MNESNHRGGNNLSNLILYTYIHALYSNHKELSGWKSQSTIQLLTPPPPKVLFCIYFCIYILSHVVGSKQIKSNKVARFILWFDERKSERVVLSAVVSGRVCCLRRVNALRFISTGRGDPCFSLVTCNTSDCG